MTKYKPLIGVGIDDKLSLNHIAELFQVHPRTILRAVEQDVNAYWADDHNPAVSIKELADAYGCKPQIIIRLAENRDSLLNASEAAKMMKIRPRTFRRNRPRCLRSGGIVRFERSIIVGQAMLRGVDFDVVAIEAALLQ